ncbi:MAG TPA: peptide chain release factor-like protein [Planctomycetota bacterium]|nr:peptide chain release factor-like protein [Planctomycetota bacterium]
MNHDTLVVKLAGDLGVAPSKLEEVKARIERLGIDLGAVEERFIRGGGKGGQKINKTANCVQLRYRDLVVRCQRDRKRAVNRFLALRELVDRVEMKASPGTSARLVKARKENASKDRVARRARARHRAIGAAGEEE